MEGRSLKWYTCGPTVCDPPHLGHCRTYLTFDIVRRILENYFNYDVTLVMGVTDIDDRIIIRTRLLEALVNDGYPWRACLQALTEVWGTCLCDQRTLELARGWLEKNSFKVENPQATIPQANLPKNGNEGLNTLPLTREMESQFFRDMARLGIKPPTVITRVTEYIPNIISFVEKIIENGFAYESTGNVYFDIPAFMEKHTYAKLMPCSADDEGALTGNCEGILQCNEVAKKEKRHPKDFILWKKSKEGEPKWLSPWGYGRPGWHIECSVMASEILGDRFDIHSGGEDLKFPHHDNELAQSEARWCKHQWVNYFIHHGHLHIDGRNMANTLKSFVTIEGALERYTATQLRMLFLLHPYDGALMFSHNSMTVARHQEEVFTSFFSQMNKILASQPTFEASQAWSVEENRLLASFARLRTEIHKALCNNFDTATAMSYLKDLAKLTMDYIEAVTERNVKILIIHNVVNYIKKLFQSFGLLEPGQDNLNATQADAAFSNPEVKEVVSTLLEFKKNIQMEIMAKVKGDPEALKEAVQRLCNELVDDKLMAKGITVDETTQATTWSYEPNIPNRWPTPTERNIEQEKIAVLMSLPTLPPV
eukprot:TRINITY_DN6561_c0_g1_i1.p1 TRINITY_DN6561_c0_g1~~TRINITY_DN6561_c0_g1_i1.p1  ORF type:complete len:675 (+),score=123.82 TRINITY_DN6561_c0_g1_i1:242-2026(+)